MLFRQLFDAETSTYTYILADEKTQQAIIIDSVQGHTDAYLRLFDELSLQLIACMETHTHADHITAAAKLAAATNCDIVQGQESQAGGVSRHISDGDFIHFGHYQIKSLYTPGHTDDSYSFFIDNGNDRKLFSGDTLLIRSTGRTDFQSGSALAQYHSLFDKLLQLPEGTKVYPGHDYKGWTVSTIGEEKRHNPRLQVANAEQYCQLMNELKLARPKMMDIAVPANLKCGYID
ncbi:MAG: MBL fold metallo-hydrolase [Candidatus Endonucleobacter bathymodioli]|uniref:MBL fold metallo-hydrolase n=1 Tax=Candidatus Endonucleibacter bathymodioli TaxID=539814 RepID=A0AA90P1I7_9GAMM|nr:MBL fold metallo-hydrolase [Candidatus Endonucleobacter bathymodioli]